MKNPCARHNDILTESLVAETILYDKTNHRAHSLNQTVALVWESADGRRSTDEIAGILHRDLGVPEDRNVVLLALEELSAAGLLEEPAAAEKAPALLSRRQVARRLALAGASAAMLPLVATVLAPTPAMASSGVVYSEAEGSKDLDEVYYDSVFDPKYYFDPTAQNDMGAAEAAFKGGNYAAEISDLDGVLSSLGLPPLS